MAAGMLASLGAAGVYNRARRRAAARARDGRVSDSVTDLDALMLYPARRRKLMHKIKCAYVPWASACRRKRKRARGPPGEKRRYMYAQLPSSIQMILGPHPFMKSAKKNQDF